MTFMLNLFAMLAAALAAGPALAQSYPAKPVQLISPYPQNSSADAAARIIAEALSPRLGQPVVANAQGRASGRAGMASAARAAPDGYTLVLSDVTLLALPFSGPAALQYNAAKDFSPVSLVAAADFVLVVPASAPARSLRDLIDLARSRDGELTYGSPGELSLPHLAAEMFGIQAKVKLLRAPYEGAGAALAAVLKGETGIMFALVPAVQQHVNIGRLRALATTGTARSLRGVPTMKEHLADYYVTHWQGVLAPAGVPREIVDRLQQEIARAIADPKVAQAYANLGTRGVSSTAEQFRAFIGSETGKFAKVIKATQ